MIPIADRWFDMKRVDDSITLLWEPHVIPLMRCNIWHVRGRDRDLMIDTGMGIASLTEAAKHLLTKSVTAVATHTHADHIGSHCECASETLNMTGHGVRGGNRWLTVRFSQQVRRRQRLTWERLEELLATDRQSVKFTIDFGKITGNSALKNL